MHFLYIHLIYNFYIFSKRVSKDRVVHHQELIVGHRIAQVRTIVRVYPTWTHSHGLRSSYNTVAAGSDVQYVYYHLPNPLIQLERRS
jgi:hypothetical protein